MNRDLKCIKHTDEEWRKLRRKMFRDHPRHDFTSHAADAFRYLAVGLENRQAAVRPAQKMAMNEYNPFTL